MKIAILTQALRTNYGGILQNYALQVVLKRKGHTVVTLQRNQEMKVKYPRYILTLIKRLVLKIAGRYRDPLFYEKKYNEDFPIFTKYTYQFVSKYISYRVYDNLSAELFESDYDSYVVGSDQVWRPSYNKIEDTFLAFTKGWNVHRYAYAASFGTDNWEFTPNQTRICFSLASLFDFITVREESGISLCKNNLNVHAEHVLDPTLLLHRQDYEDLIANAETTPSQGQLFVHFLDKTDDKDNLVKHIAQSKQWKPFSVNCQYDEHELSQPVATRVQPPIEQWLRSFKDADFVITDSFHAMVFSIIFNKTFIIYGNKERGLARFTSLLRMFGLEKRIITCSDEFDIKLCEDINYNEVNTKLNGWREKSMSFINKLD